MSEANFWKYIKDNIGHRGHFSRVESHLTSAGIPDVDYCIRGVESHIELKFEWDCGAEIRGTQCRWFRKRINAGGHPWVLTEIKTKAEGSYYMLHGGNWLRYLADHRSFTYWFTTATKVWRNEIDWEELITYLTRGYYD